jgi:hypothetical protein
LISFFSSTTGDRTGGGVGSIGWDNYSDYSYSHSGVVCYSSWTKWNCFYGFLGGLDGFFGLNTTNSCWVGACYDLDCFLFFV